MAPDPQCAALAAAKARTGLSYGEIASRINSTEQRVTAICTGTTRPSEAEFSALARALGITSSVPHTGVHATV